MTPQEVLSNALVRVGLGGLMSEDPTTDEFAALILAALPQGWALAERDTAQVLALADEWAAALRKAQGGCGSLLWLANNLHNADTPTWRLMLMDAITDAQTGYDAAVAALAKWEASKA